MASISRKPARKEIGEPRRGEVWLVALDPTVDHEIKKTRPALVIQNDVGNRHSPLTIVAAMTSKLARVPYPVEVVVDPTRANGLQVPSAIRLDQIRTVDRRRLIRRMGVVSAAIQGNVDRALKISLGLVDF
jgi:mRNA interferase MazF